MELKENTQQPEGSDFIPLDIDDIEEVEFSDEVVVAEVDVKESQLEKNTARKSIEDIMEARALRRELADLFDDDLLLD